MIVSIIALVFGFFLFIKGADFFVDGAASTAGHLKVSKMLIGLTIIAFGTSAPEFAVSMQALANHSTDMVLGNVIGSCILNILLILGIAAMIHPIKITDNTVKKELPIALLISTLLAVLMLDIKLNNSQINQVTRSDAIVILLFFSIFLYYLINLAKKNKEEKKEEKPKHSLIKSLLFIGVGLASIIIGSDLVVKNASNIAEAFGISERVISLTIIALGTSLPELVTTIVASSKGEQDLLLGNIIGSNIFNICVVLGIPVSIFGTITPKSFTVVDLIALVGSALVLFIFSLTKKKISRFEGALLFFSFLAYYILLIIF